MSRSEKNEIKLNVTDSSVEISAEHKEEKEDKKKNFLRKERSQISYYRTIPLSEKIVSGKTKSKLVDGVLTITLPKSKPTRASKKKLISVQQIFYFLTNCSRYFSLPFLLLGKHLSCLLQQGQHNPSQFTKISQ